MKSEYLKGLDFFTLRAGNGKSALWLKPETEFDSWRILRGEKPLEPIVFSRMRGKSTLDFLGTTFGIVRLISKRAAKVLEDASVTGWRYLPVRVKLPGIQDSYGIFQVTGRAADFEYSRMKLLRRDEFREYGDLVLSRAKWDGSDIFLPGKNGTILVLPRVVDLVKLHELSNFEFAAAEDSPIVC